MKLSSITQEDFNEIIKHFNKRDYNLPLNDLNDLSDVILNEFMGNLAFQKLFNYTEEENLVLQETLKNYEVFEAVSYKIRTSLTLVKFDVDEGEDSYQSGEDMMERYSDEYPVDDFEGYLHALDFENEEDLTENAMSMNCVDINEDVEFTVYFLDGKVTHAYDLDGDDLQIEDDFVKYLEGKLVDAFNEFPENEVEEVTAQQYIQQKVQEAQKAKQIVTESESDKETAKRLNISEDQLRTLRNIAEKTRMSLKTPKATVDRSGKKAKSKVIKMVSFNDSFEKGMVFMEYPHLKGWLVFSMGASEFFRKVNVRLKK